MAVKRQYQRFIAKLPVELMAGDLLLKGSTVRISEKGFFVRAQKSFSAGTPVDITLHLTDDETCTMKGIIRHVRNIALLTRENGMGIELTAKDKKYEDYVKAIRGSQ